MTVQIVIKGRKYKEKNIFTLDKARRKKEVVWFVDRDKYSDYICTHLDYSDLQKLRLNIYNKYYKLVKFVPFKEVDINGNIFEGWEVSSPIIEIDTTDFANLIPNRDYRKRFYVWDSLREKYYFNDKFVNFINLGQNVI